jgi:hypothetical protein
MVSGNDERRGQSCDFQLTCLDSAFERYSRGYRWLCGESTFSYQCPVAQAAI